MSDSIKITNCTEIVQNIKNHLQTLKAETFFIKKFITSSKELLLILEQVCTFLQTNPLSIVKTDKTHDKGVSQLFHEY